MKVSQAIPTEARLSDVVRSAQDVFRRRFKMLALITLAATILGTVLTLTATPRYQGITRIQIDPSRNPLSKGGSEAAAQLASEGIETEVQVMSSMDLARSVARRLNLLQDPELTKGLASAQTDHAYTVDEKIDFVANALEKNLDVAREKLTYVITLKYQSTNPDKAAKIANEFAAAYLDSKVSNNIGTAQKQSDFYKGQLAQMGDDARAADEQVAQFEAKTGMVAASNVIGTITDQQIGPLSVQMASADLISAEARSKEISGRQMVAHGQLDLISEVRNSATIVALKQNKALLVQTLADMRQRYGESYPDMVKVKDQISAIDEQIHSEANRVVQSLKSDADAAEAQASSLRNAMHELENKKADEAHASVMLASLQRDADSKHSAYDRMAQATLDTRQATQGAFAQAQVIDVAKPPLAPFYPKPLVMISLSLFLGFCAGIATIVAQEMMVTGLTSVQDIEGELGLTLLAAVPFVRGNDHPADLLIEKPTSQFAEALRNARASILGVKGEDPPKIIAMTSSLPNEGKTTTALALARTMALNGSRTLILDVDVRRAQLRNIVDVSDNGYGTIELLHNEVSLDQAIQKTGLEKLDVLMVRKPYFSSENLFDNDNIHKILEDLSTRYDFDHIGSSATRWPGRWQIFVGPGRCGGFGGEVEFHAEPGR